MKNIFFDGNFNTGAKKCPETAEINFKHFEGQLENSTFSGNFHLNNLDKPHLKFQIDADVDLLSDDENQEDELPVDIPEAEKEAIQSKKK